ncbi:MAG: hypothetical protein HGGPFJEG_01508 [Ignavibacteria bacterium]|nr:hypothetical protein [Ignavibacteria bacterium]
MDFTFKTDYNFFFILAVLAAAIIIAYLYYRKSKLETSRKRIFLILRTVSVFLLLLLFLSPVISFFGNVSRTPVNVFLIDNSESLTIENRFEKLKELIDEKNLKSAGKNSDNRFFLFAGNILKEINYGDINSIEYTGINNFQTNLSQSITSLEEILSGGNLSSVTIISDGIINEGGNPVYRVKQLNVPVNYILTGDTVQKNDLSLRTVFYNKSSFIESRVPIKAEINSYNYDRNIAVNLFEENRLIDSKEIKVIPGQIRYEAGFSVFSNTESIKKFRIEISPAEDEITLKNNFEEFFIKFTDNKFKVLVISGGPGADFAFIKEEILKIKNFDAVFRTQKSQNEFYEGNIPADEKFDCCILIGFPAQQTSTLLMNEIREIIISNKATLIFLSSRNTDYAKLSQIEELLPFTVSSYSPNETETKVNFVGKLNPDLNFSYDVLKDIGSFPAIFRTQTVFSAKPSAETMLITDRNSEPAMLIQNTSNKRSAAFLVYGFYKWRLNSKSINSSEVFNKLITNSILMLSDKEAKKKFIVETTKPVYSKFESVIFNAKLNKLDVKGNEKIRVSIKGKDFNQSLELIRKDNLIFQGKTDIASDGDYEYSAELISGNNVEENTIGKFSIGINNFEYKSTRADNMVLRQMANETMGTDFGSMQTAGASDFLSKINEKSEISMKTMKNFELNINPYYLFGLILILCMEWFLRKRNNLP